MLVHSDPICVRLLDVDLLSLVVEGDVHIGWVLIGILKGQPPSLLLQHRLLDPLLYVVARPVDHHLTLAHVSDALLCL